MSSDQGRGTQISRLRLILLPEQDIEVSMIQTLSNVNSASSVAQLAKSWLEDCHNKHSSCRHNLDSPGWKPTRLIYVGSPDEDIPPRLCSSSAVPIDKTYITLSHCWGLIEMFKLVSANIMDLMISLPLSELNSVFRDTVDLVRQLGVDYVWIDSLCIIQDSVEDWNRESAMMGKIYKHSFCNIAATGFQNGSKSFYVQRVPEVIQPEKFFVKLELPKSKSGSKAITGPYYCLGDIWSAGVTTAPLNQRAWVFQERLLAPRVLHMGSEQVFWECRELEACENFPNGIPMPIRSNFKKELAAIITLPVPVVDTIGQNGTKSTSLEAIGERAEQCGPNQNMLDLWWNKILPGYNSSQLTRFEDKLVAISGIAKEMHNHIRGEYVAGLWGGCLLDQLIWYVPTWSKRGIHDVLGKSQRPQEYQAPSWSWAAINGPVGLMLGSNTTPLAAVVEYKVILATESKYGRIMGGCLRISGLLSRAAFVKNDEYLRKNWINGGPIRLKGSTSTEILIIPLLFPDVRGPVAVREHGSTYGYPARDAIGSRTFWILPICKNGAVPMGLMLLPSTSGTRGEYRRIGIFVMGKDKWLSGLKSSIPFLDSHEYETFGTQGYTISIVQGVLRSTCEHMLDAAASQEFALWGNSSVVF